MVGAIASSTLATLFALALLASGQNATITGTLTGQIVMEGFIDMKVSLRARRLITRMIAICPVIICIMIWGDRNDVVEKLLVYTQVFLSIALPISMAPLIYITSSKKWMGEFANSKMVCVIGWVCAAVLIVLNLQLIQQVVVMLSSL